MATFGPSPREAPLIYPGHTPPTSGLVTDGPYLPVEPLPGRRLAQARVVLGADRPAALAVGISRVSLGYALLALNAVPIEARVPVLAVGSNAAIAQMQAKFQAAGISCAMPLTWARVTGIRVGAAAIVSRWGYIPAAPVFEPGVTTRLAVNWLDPEQLRALDETETGYERRLVDDGDDTRVQLESGERLCTFGIYVSTSGVLADSDGRRPMDLPGQEELIRQLLARGDRGLRVLAGRGVPGFLRAATDREGRARLVEALRGSAGIAVLNPPTPTRAGELATYDAGRGGLAPPAGVAGAVQVAPTPDSVDRGGEQAVVLPDSAVAGPRPAQPRGRALGDGPAGAGRGRPRAGAGDRRRGAGRPEHPQRARGRDRGVRHAGAGRRRPPPGGRRPVSARPRRCCAGSRRPRWSRPSGPRPC